MRKCYQNEVIACNIVIFHRERTYIFAVYYIFVYRIFQCARNACKYLIFLSFFSFFYLLRIPLLCFVSHPFWSLPFSLFLSFSLQLLPCPTLVLHSFGFSARYGVNILERSRDKAVIGGAIVNLTKRIVSTAHRTMSNLFVKRKIYVHLERIR